MRPARTRVGTGAGLLVGALLVGATTVACAGATAQPMTTRTQTTSVASAAPTPAGALEPSGASTPPPEPEPTADASSSGGLYLDPTTQAATAAAAASGDTRQLLDMIALTPTATWVGSWSPPDVAAQQVAQYTAAARAAGRTGVLTIYAIPGRDCGSYSGGGVAASEYSAWVDAVAGAIEGSPIVVLEPDALAQLGDCDGQGDRVGFLRYAARSLAQAGARVYVDAGNSAWLSADEAARRLLLVGFDHAVGFALNTSNYRTTTESVAYGEKVSALVGDKGYVVDTSRNGNGSDGEWCNPRGRALGEPPRLVDDATALDALLWVKMPGESDGTCNGGPPAGQWWQEVALELAGNASR